MRLIYGLAPEKTTIAVWNNDRRSTLTDKGQRKKPTTTIVSIGVIDGSVNYLQISLDAVA